MMTSLLEFDVKSSMIRKLNHVKNSYYIFIALSSLFYVLIGFREIYFIRNIKKRLNEFQ